MGSLECLFFFLDKKDIAKLRCVSKKWDSAYNRNFFLLSDNEKPSIRQLDQLFFQRKE